MMPMPIPTPPLPPATRAVLLRIREWLAGRTSESPSAMARELDAVLSPLQVGDTLEWLGGDGGLWLYGHRYAVLEVMGGDRCRVESESGSGSTEALAIERCWRRIPLAVLEPPMATMVAETKALVERLGRERDLRALLARARDSMVANYPAGFRHPVVMDIDAALAPPPAGGEPRPAPERVRLDELLARIRGGEWSVAVHNDYRLDGITHTFWLFTHPDGRWVKGEGRSDVEALEGSLCRLFPPSALATGGRIPSHRTSSECVSAGDIGDTHGEHGHSCGICGGDVPCAEVEACALATAEVPGVGGGYEAYEDPHTREMLYRPRAPAPPAEERDENPGGARPYNAATLEQQLDAYRTVALEERQRHAAELTALRAAHEETVRERDEVRFGLACTEAACDQARAQRDVLAEERDRYREALRGAAADLGRAANWLETGGLGISGEQTRRSEVRARRALGDAVKGGTPT